MQNDSNHNLIYNAGVLTLSCISKWRWTARELRACKQSKQGRSYPIVTFGDVEKASQIPNFVALSTYLPTYYFDELVEFDRNLV